jgi:Ca2+-binding EF-hand superfamily protein
MNIRTLIVTPLACLAVLSFVAGAAQAREPGMPRSERTFERLDRNNNGELERQELGARSERRFMRLDTDKDGRVTRGEIEAWVNAMAQRRVDRIMSLMDANNDGVIAQSEVEDYVSSLFLAADTDTSGGVTLTEARAYHEAKRKSRAEARKRASASPQQ